MRIIEPSIEVFFHFPRYKDYVYTQEEFIEQVGRTCYKSEERIKNGSAPKFVKMLNDRGHGAMLEHCGASAKFVCERGLTHELVRHRLASFAQESTRYCNYSKDKFGQAIGVIMPPFTTTDGRAEAEWRQAGSDAERHYFNLLEIGEPPQIARSVLPICLKTEIWITANLREWQHIFKMRCAKSAHPQIQDLMLKALVKFNQQIPSMYADLYKEFIKDVQD